MTGTRETRDSAEFVGAVTREAARQRLRGAPAGSRSSLTWTTVVMVARTVCEVDRWTVLVARPFDMVRVLVLSSRLGSWKTVVEEYSCRPWSRSALIKEWSATS